MLLFVTINLLIWAIRRARRRGLGGQELADSVAAMRHNILTGTAKDLSIREDLPVWGCVMEMGLPEGVASLVALNSGHTSLYYSNGGGVIGSGCSPPVAAASQALCQRAVEFAHLTTFTTTTPYPEVGHVRFYLRTPEGLRTAECPEPELASRAHPLTPLYDASHEVLTQIRLNSPRGI